MKPEQFDLNDERIFADMLLHPRIIAENKKSYIVLGVVSIIVLCGVLMPLLQLMSEGFIGWLLVMPFILYSLIYLPILLQNKVISDYGVFIINHKGKVKRGFLWSELKGVTYKIIRTENSVPVFKIIIQPEKGRAIKLRKIDPNLSAHIIAFCIQRESNKSIDLKQQRLRSSEEQLFYEMIQELTLTEITIEQLNTLKGFAMSSLMEGNISDIYEQ